MELLKGNKYWHHLLYAHVVSFCVTRECQKIGKIDKNSCYWRRKYSYLLNDLRNFNETFRKDVAFFGKSILFEMSLWRLMQRLRDISKRADLQIYKMSPERLIRDVSSKTSLRYLSLFQKVVLCPQTISHFLATCSCSYESLNIMSN